MKHFITSLRMLAALTVLTGFAYPLIVTGLAQGLFPKQAGGSLIEREGKVIGSELIAQKFENERYFWPRPSSQDYNPMPSGGSNLGPTSKKLKEGTEAAKAKLGADAPAHLLYASASGLDPEISPDAAFYQVARVAKARGLGEDRIKDLVTRRLRRPDLGFLGDARVNVLLLNLDLDRLVAEGTR